MSIELIGRSILDTQGLDIDNEQTAPPMRVPSTLRLVRLAHAARPPIAHMTVDSGADNETADGFHRARCETATAGGTVDSSTAIIKGGRGAPAITCYILIYPAIP